MHDDIATNPLRTREDARRLLDDLTRPLLGCFSPGRARVRLAPDAAHFDRRAEWFEGFARPLWGLAPLHAGGGDFAQWQMWRDGIVSGTDPQHPEYWGAPGDHDQRSVEMAAMGFALALARDALWDPLSDRQQANFAAWLGSIQPVGMADNNWHFFPVLAGLGLQHAGVAIDEAARDRHLERLEEFYQRDGWYGDGLRGTIDHYNGFAIQFYGLLYAVLAGGRDPRRAGLYRDRAAQFAQGFAHWFGDDGATLCIGRSLTYRFATAAFWGALAYAGLEALPWGQVRGLWARQLRWWTRQPMLDARGVLSVGYRWPNYLMSEEYNSPGSPYWAFKAFLPLALPADHPFWTAEEAPHPARDGVVTLHGAQMVVSRQDGDVVALPGGPARSNLRGATDKYNKLAYSTRFGLGVEALAWIDNGFCGDNILAVSAEPGIWRGLGEKLSSRVAEGTVATTWQPLADVTIETLQAFAGGWEVRLHVIETARPLAVLESGHAVPTRIGSRRLNAGDPAEAEDPAGVVLALDDGSCSAAVDLLGLRRGHGMDMSPNTSLMFPRSAVPVLSGLIPAGRTVLASAIRAAHRADAAALLSALPDAATLSALPGWPEVTGTAPDVAVLRLPSDPLVL